MTNFDTLLDKKGFLTSILRNTNIEKDSLYWKRINKFLGKHSKPLEEKTEECNHALSKYQGMDKCFGCGVSLKPTPEPEDCKHSEIGENSESENFGDCLKCGKHIRSKFSGLLLAQFDEPKSKVPEPIFFWSLSGKVEIEEKLHILRNKYNELVSYLKEKEDNE